jgi:threonylcarbamoyladenosine tRNA methylthiotransferase MtaB
MRRRYRRAGFLERCRRIRQQLDRPALTTDVIVGFPGESDADFEATCDVVREAGFSKVHVFSWSPRRGTPAAEMDGRVPAEIIAKRREQMQALSDHLTGVYQRQLVGRRVDVLVEGADPRRPGNVVGTSCRYVPVSFPAHSEALLGRRVPVTIVSASIDRLIGEPLPDSISDLPSMPKGLVGGRSPLPLVG